MTDFEKYQASTEARQASHGEHIDKLTGYFLAETNRMRSQQESLAADEPVAEPPPEPAVRPRRRWWRRH